MQPSGAPAGDAIVGDKVGGDKLAGDKIVDPLDAVNVDTAQPRTDDLDLILVGPGGVWAVQVKATRAPLRVQADRWEVRRGGRWVAAKPDPGAQVTRQATALNDFFKRNGVMRFVERAVALADPQPFDQFSASAIRVWLPFDIERRAQALTTRLPPTVAELTRINALLGQRAVEQRAVEAVGKRRR